MLRAGSNKIICSGQEVIYAQVTKHTTHNIYMEDFVQQYKCVGLAQIIVYTPCSKTFITCQVRSEVANI